MNLAQIRREYRATGMDAESLHASPFRQFELWLQDVRAAGLGDITAMVLASVSAAGAPSQRIVLLKDLSDEGFTFFTHTESRKAQDIRAESRVSLLFPWQDLDRQVIVGGTAEPLNRAAVTAYFASRPRASQLAAWSSAQSQPLADRRQLLAAYATHAQRFADQPIPPPDFWGGYLVRPTRFEFWQGRENRLHDRFEYKTQGDTQGDTWQLQRLAP